MLARSGRRVVLIEPNISRLSFFSSFFCEEKQGTKKKRELFPKLWKLETEGKISGTLFSFEYLDFFVVVGNSEKTKKQKKAREKATDGALPSFNQWSYPVYDGLQKLFSRYLTVL